MDISEHQGVRSITIFESASGRPPRSLSGGGTVYPVVPPKVECTLTEMAQELHKSLLGLTDWAQRHGNTVAAAQAAYDRERNRAASGSRPPAAPAQRAPMSS